MVTFIEVTEKEVIKLQEVLKRKPSQKLKRRIEYLQKLLKFVSVREKSSDVSVGAVP